MRLDKLLSNMGVGSRKDVKGLIKKKFVTVNNTVIKDSSLYVDPEKDVVKVNNEPVEFQQYVYIMLNKPSEYISATVDNREKTVIDLLPVNYNKFNPFPIGRLDKDTEGLLLLTNDGDLAHQLVSPKKDVGKTYYAKVNGYVTDDDIETFKKGITLDDGYQSKPADLVIMDSASISEVKITITEGKFHQVKRMFEAVGKKVVYLKRLSMGELQLDSNLALGESRELTKDELDYCLSLKK
ncbi:pseudouridine synthase [Virgibacillus siamensis]|uniref:pseudouridine synthase n=1 Tax=Virgibacillus siamensis TaxID=480071 RepID=UPI0009872F2B|nr:pseudouridine synthase [Virgibacillus siamensis]